MAENQLTNNLKEDNFYEDHSWLLKQSSNLILEQQQEIAEMPPGDCNIYKAKSMLSKQILNHARVLKMFKNSSSAYGKPTPAASTPTSAKFKKKPQSPPPPQEKNTKTITNVLISASPWVKKTAWYLSLTPFEELFLNIDYLFKNKMLYTPYSYDLRL